MKVSHTDARAGFTATFTKQDRAEISTFLDDYADALDVMAENLGGDPKKAERLRFIADWFNPHTETDPRPDEGPYVNDTWDTPKRRSR